MSDQAIKMPNVGQFRNVVQIELQNWCVTNVEGLCTSQTQTVITGLAQYYGDPAITEPEVQVFKKVFSDFQEKKERTAFSDVTDPEVQELIVVLAPYFQELQAI